MAYHLQVREEDMLFLILPFLAIFRPNVYVMMKLISTMTMIYKLNEDVIS